jgi:dTDP-4-amino-4,6-dideoxygalactose transaminase
MKPISYGKQEITEEDIKIVNDVLRSDFLTQGPAVAEFEKKFAEYVGAKYAVAVSNGTAALHLCALAIGVVPGQKVIATPITFAASSNCILYCGGEVEFVDIDPESFCMDYNKVKALLEKSPKGTYSGMVPVDFAGYPVDLEKFHDLAKEHGLWIIEDACHAPGGAFLDSKNKWQKCGNSEFADLAIFSFHPVKHIASGEGGMITTNNPELYNKLIMLRTHGITKDPLLMEEVSPGGWYYEMQVLGYNYRMPDMLLLPDMTASLKNYLLFYLKDTSGLITHFIYMLFSLIAERNFMIFCGLKIYFLKFIMFQFPICLIIKKWDILPN